MSMKSPLGRARGLGSAKEGAGHWTAQRVTAIFLVPLSLWFAVAVIGLSHADYATFKGWMGNPGNSALMLLTVFAVLYHAQLGVQVVIEDYVPAGRHRLRWLVANALLWRGLMLAGIFAVLKIALGA